MDIYSEHKRLLKLALSDLTILSGDRGGGGTTWQNVAGTAEVNLTVLASFMKLVREGGRHWRGQTLTGPVVFASPSEVLEEI